MSHLCEVDPQVFDFAQRESDRQRDSIRLIASENYVSHAVLEATGSVFTNKYSEGNVGRRHYEGQQLVDPLEKLTIDRATSLFGVKYANVQAYSGSPANMAVCFGLLDPGDSLLGMALSHGGHLTHGFDLNFSAQYYDAHAYHIDTTTGLIDYDDVVRQAEKVKPKLIICGSSAYPRTIDFARFSAIAKDVGAYLLADISHISGLVVGGMHPSPTGLADVIMTTTHKSLRGPRGALILTDDGEIIKTINRAIMPGLQGGPHNHTTAAIAVALLEASAPEFKTYAAQIVANAKALAEALLAHGFEMVSGGTDIHLVLIDTTNKGISGKKAAVALDKAGIETNANAIPDDPRRPMDPSGLRLGTPATTSRGMKKPQMIQIANWINRIVNDPTNESLITDIRTKVADLCVKFPAPGIE
jgi:glycine hydroxymethyltransferase